MSKITKNHSSYSTNYHPEQKINTAVHLPVSAEALSEASSWLARLVLQPQSSVKSSTCDQQQRQEKNPLVVKPSFMIGLQVWSIKIRHRLMTSGAQRPADFFSYFAHSVSFLLAPRARKKWALSVAAFTVLLRVILEKYVVVFFIWK